MRLAWQLKIYHCLDSLSLSLLAINVTAGCLHKALLAGFSFNTESQPCDLHRELIPSFLGEDIAGTRIGALGRAKLFLMLFPFAVK